MNTKPMVNLPLKDYLEIIQVIDSTFPIGSFNHSFGMENYLREDTVTDAKGYENWQEAYLATQFKYGEGLVIKLVYDALTTGNGSSVWDYDHMLTVATPARETRQGTQMIAKQMLRLIQRLHPLSILADYQTKIRQGTAHGNPAIVFALYAYEKGLAWEEAITLYGYSVVSTMVQNAVRTIPLGQLSGQEIVLRSFAQLEALTEAIQTLDASYLGANVPGIELAQMKHETQIFRLFMS